MEIFFTERVEILWSQSRVARSQKMGCSKKRVSASEFFSRPGNEENESDRSFFSFQTFFQNEMMFSMYIDKIQSY